MNKNTENAIAAFVADDIDTLRDIIARAAAVASRRFAAASAAAKSAVIDELYYAAASAAVDCDNVRRAIDNSDDIAFVIGVVGVASADVASVVSLYTVGAHDTAEHRLAIATAQHAIADAATLCNIAAAIDG